MNVPAIIALVTAISFCTAILGVVIGVMFTGRAIGEGGVEILSLVLGAMLGWVSSYIAYNSRSPPRQPSESSRPSEPETRPEPPTDP